MTTKRKAAASRKTDAAEIIRALMDGPKTLLELCEVVEFTERTTENWVLSFRKAGIVRIYDRLPHKQFVYALQVKPFGEADAPLHDRKRTRQQSAPKRDFGAQVAQAEAA